MVIYSVFAWHVGYRDYINMNIRDVQILGLSCRTHRILTVSRAGMQVAVRAAQEAELLAGSIPTASTCGIAEQTGIGGLDASVDGVVADERMGAKYNELQSTKKPEQPSPSCMSSVAFSKQVTSACFCMRTANLYLIIIIVLFVTNAWHHTHTV
eukprot:SAG31_NODE_795_length_12036_cov_28.879953_3_plen_154_part_00